MINHLLKICCAALLMGVVSPASALWVNCAMENDVCTLDGSKLVRYGAGDSWNEGTFTDSVACNNSVFGDPKVNHRKKCQYSEDTNVWTKCATEGQTCKVNGTKAVRYGKGSTWTESIVSKSVECSNSEFTDPLEGELKECQVSNISWTKCADENKMCRFDGKKLVRYGKGDTWFEKQMTNGVACNNSVFGDPLVGTYKSCEYAKLPSNNSNNSNNSNQDLMPPQNLKMTQLQCSSGTLTWSAAQKSGGTAFYDVYYDGQFLAKVDGDKTSADLDLTPGADWGFYVNALDASGNVSQPSQTLQVQIPQCENDSVKPSVPKGLTGKASGTSVTLNWQAADDNIGVTGYQILRDNKPVATTSDLNYVDSSLAQDRQYSYSVIAKDAQNNASDPSQNVQITTGSTCSSAICNVEEVASDKDIPWGLVTLPDGSVLYSRRDAHDIIHLKNGKKTTIGSVPNVNSTDGEGGLLGLAVTSKFPANDSWLYIFHTSPSDNRVVRIRYKDGRLDTSTRETLLSGIGRNKFHNGGRMRFGPDGKLYVATGDAQSESSAQNIDSLAGKVLRMNPDGSVPSDNPFNNYVWSYGHRNPQGLAFDSRGRLWQQEFGNSELDETNLIQKGGNYGWPNCEATNSRKGQGCSTSGYIAPKQTYQTVNGSCSGIAIVDDALFVACLRGKRMYRVEISGNRLTNKKQLFVGTYGRLRTVEPSIDGGLWLNTSNGGDKDSTPNNSDNKILKITLGND